MSEQTTGQEQQNIAIYPPKQMFGRRKIFTSETEITAGNVTKVVENAYVTHLLNRGEIEYLWNYYKGKQPSLYRHREVRDELTSHIVENRANEIVSFKVGFIAGKPIQYVSSVSEDKVSEAVTKLNDAMRMIGKHTRDKELVEWQMIAGIGYRYVVQAKNPKSKVPFNLYTLDPRNTSLSGRMTIPRKSLPESTMLSGKTHRKYFSLSTRTTPCTPSYRAVIRQWQ